MTTKRLTENKRTVRTEYSAGGIVYRIRPKGPEIAFILDSYRKWTFPKGRIQKGEKIERAAVRESQEEMGLRDLKIIRKLGRIDIWFVDRFEYKGELIHKYIYYVLLQAPARAQLRKPEAPKHGEIIRAVRWVPVKQALKFSAYKDMQPIIRKALQYFKRA